MAIADFIDFTYQVLALTVSLSWRSKAANARHKQVKEWESRTRVEQKPVWHG